MKVKSSKPRAEHVQRPKSTSEQGQFKQQKVQCGWNGVDNKKVVKDKVAKVDRAPIQQRFLNQIREAVQTKKN